MAYGYNNFYFGFCAKTVSTVPTVNYVVSMVNGSPRPTKSITKNEHSVISTIILGLLIYYTNNLQYQIKIILTSTINKDLLKEICNKC